MKTPLLVLLFLVATTAALAQPNLQLISVPPADDRVDPADPFTYTFRAASLGSLTDVRLVHSLPPGAHFLSFSAGSPRWSCSESAGAVVCLRPNYGFSGSDPNDNLIALTVSAPDDPSGKRFTTTTTFESVPAGSISQAKVTMTVFRTFTVTTPGDFGAGTLRDAIDQANDACDGGFPCKIRFAEPMRIAPQTPLPLITACGLIIQGGPYDPNTHARALDLARRVEISGAEVSEGSGFVLSARCAEGSLLKGTTLRALTINAFPENGIEVRSPNKAKAIVEGCFIGTDVSGRTAVPNLRGISVLTPDAWIDVSYSLIAGNARSGIALWSGSAVQSRLFENLIGIRFGGDPLPNGGSGIFVNGGEIYSQRNTIEYNGEFGVAIGPGARHFLSQYDYIANNGGIAVDWGLNGPGNAPGSNVVIPQLTDAVYDPASNQTLIAGVLTSADREYYDAELFVSPGDFQGGYYIGTVPLGLADGTTKSFVARVRGNWTGAVITAHSMRRHQADGGTLDSSEWSAGIRVR